MDGKRSNFPNPRKSGQEFLQPLKDQQVIEKLFPSQNCVGDGRIFMRARSAQNQSRHDELGELTLSAI